MDDDYLQDLRLREADRSLEQHGTLDELLPEGHLARLLWSALDGMDLSAFYEPIRTRGPNPGRPATDPKILLTLWLLATCEGVTSGRRLARFCREHLAYQWILGGVRVEVRTLNDFRRQHGKEFEELHTGLLAVLIQQGLVKLERVSQDGIRVRANAGAASYRSEQTLELCLLAAEDQLASVKEAGKERPKRRNRRQQAAQERAARDRKRRLEKALEELPAIREAKKKKDREKARASSTDPEARVMKMADGGFRPAYNIQLGVDTESRVIVQAEVTNSGGDMGKAAPMLRDIEEKTGRRPAEYLVDGGFAKHADIEEAAAKSVTVFAPVPAPRKTKGKKKDGTEDSEGEAGEESSSASKARDGPGVIAWRQRMATHEAKEIYKVRAATVETANGDLRAHRGWHQIPLRGFEGAKAFVYLGVLANTLLRAFKLGARLGG